MAIKRSRKRQKPVTEIRKARSVAGKAELLSQKTVKKLAREWQVFELRRDGWTVEQIAQHLNVGSATVRGCLIDVLNRTITETAETAEENRQLQIDRLDNLLKRFMADALTGNMAAASLVIQIEGRRAKLLALDVPEVKKVDVTGIREYVGVDVSQV